MYGQKQFGIAAAPRPGMSQPLLGVERTAPGQVLPLSQAVPPLP